MYGELVSVIMPTHNSSRFLAASIESVLRQTYRNLELLIADDCPTDSTHDILESFAGADKRISVEFLTEHICQPIRKRQDWALFLNILKDCQICFCLQEPLAYYSFHRKGSVSSDKMTLIKYNVTVYETVFGYSKFKSWLYFIFLFLPSYFLKTLRVWADSRKFVANISQHQKERHW